MNILNDDLLNTSIGEFTTKNSRLSYKDLENIVRENSIFGMGKIALNLCDKYAKFFFDKIDGVPLNLAEYNRGKTTTLIRKKDGYIDKEELYQAVKLSYWCRHRVRLTDKKISNMSLKDGIKTIFNHFFDHPNDVISDHYI